ncbi:MAG: DeoR/GlpR transcriptional regulator [Chromatiaceae bacterium]|nr:DeoR/GlpR transcriptional regulator [Chromatiaceae bacterium]MCP5443424.1 DeoR/GlpR transcriptional regulator [Chromatiaceae bacterium]
MNAQVKAANLNPRQKEILNHARIRGEVHVERLAETFNVTPQTIRRDLNQLRALGLLHRVHGGAIVHDGVANLGYEARRRISFEEKEAIAHCAAQLIPDDTSMFINIGTTTEQVARHLVGRVGLLVITNNINVVNTLRECETIQVMTAGGIVRREDGGIVGDATVDFIAQFKVDFAVVGASAIEDDGTVLDYDPREVRVAQAIIANARSVILVADSTKFERNAPIRIADIGNIDYFVTDRMPSPAFMSICREREVMLVIAEGNRCNVVVDHRKSSGKLHPSSAR